MPIQGQFAVSGAVQGRSYAVTTNVNTNGALQIDESCLVAESGSLTTRTNNSAGEVTLDASAVNLATGDVVDLYWSTGQRRGVTLGTVSGTACPIASGGNGDVLPVANTTIKVAPTRVLNCSIVGNNVSAVVFDSAGSEDGMISILNSTTEVLGTRLNSGADYIWFSGSGITNPVASNTITSVRVSQGGTTANNVVRGSIQYD